MPHLTLPVALDGCVVDLFVGLSAARQAALKAANQPIPKLVKVRALLDTGASGTAIDEGVLKQLSLTPTGTVNILTPSTQGTAFVCMTYDVFLGIHHPVSSLVLGTFPVIGSSFTGEAIGALVGRDILQRCLFVYNGDAGTFALAF